MDMNFSGIALAMTHSVLLFAALALGIVLTVLAAMRRVSASTAISIAVVGFFCLVGSVVFHLVFGHGEGSPEPMAGMTFMREHGAYLVAGGILAAGLVLAITLARSTPPAGYERADDGKMARRSPGAAGKADFRSAVDAWYYVVAFGAPAAVVVIAYSAGGFKSMSEGLVVAGVIVVSALVPLWLMVSTRYTIEGDVLLVRSGPVSKKILLGDIRSVTPSHSILSAPALSLRRLDIRYGDRGQVLISPADRDGFLRAIGFEPGTAA